MAVEQPGSGSTPLSTAQAAAQKRLVDEAREIADAPSALRSVKSAKHIALCCEQFVNAHEEQRGTGEYIEALGHAANRMSALSLAMKSTSASSEEVRRRAHDLAMAMIDACRAHETPFGSNLRARLIGELGVLAQAPTGDELARDVEQDIARERAGAVVFGGGLTLVLAVIATVVMYPLFRDPPPDPATVASTELLRLVGVVPLTVLAGYMSKQAAERTAAVRRLRGLRLQLLSLDNEAFGPEALGAGTYRRSVYERLYCAYHVEDADADAGSPSVVEQLNATIQKLVEVLPTSPKN